MWGIEALKSTYDVSIVTAGPVDLDALNAHCGTSVDAGEVTVREAGPAAVARLGAALRGAILTRFARSVAPDFDVLISAYNPLNFGRPGIQCIADFSWDETIRRRLHPPPPGLRGSMHRRAWLRAPYRLAARWIGGRSDHDVFGGRDRILANSAWSAGVVRERFGVEATVLYPPVPEPTEPPPAAERSADFVALGRIAPEKRIEDLVAIVQGVRAAGHPSRLHIVGRFGEDAYGRRMAALCDRHAAWIHRDGAAYGPEKWRRLGAHRFGLHACRGEAFGIAVAEMVKAGLIPFVPAEGGQAEIVDHPRLMYGSIPEAVRTIDGVLRDPGIQTDLARHLEARSARFTTGAFQDGLRRAVDAFLDGAGGPPPCPRPPSA